MASSVTCHFSLASDCSLSCSAHLPQCVHTEWFTPRGMAPRGVVCVVHSMWHGSAWRGVRGAVTVRIRVAVLIRAA